MKNLHVAPEPPPPVFVPAAGPVLVLPAPPVFLAPNVVVPVVVVKVDLPEVTTEVNAEVEILPPPTPPA